MKPVELNRRDFLKAASLLGAGLLIGCKAKPAQGVLAAAKSEANDLAAWLHIAPDGEVTFMLPAVEMGQGVYTSLSQLICDELDAPWDKMRVRLAPLGEAYVRPNNPAGMQSTGGSASVRDWSPALRKTGATARLQLRRAAAARWQVPVEECGTEPGAVVHKSGKRLPYGDIAVEAAGLETPAEEDIILKKPAEFRLIGKDMPRLDTPLKTDGTARFGIDVVLPGMVYATVACSPVFGGKVASMDKKAALKMKGVSDVVEIPGGVAVVADSYYRAKTALFALKVKFKGGDKKFSSERLSATFREKIAENKGKPAGARVIEAEYEVPFLAHATMEPMNCTVDWTADKCDIIVPAQNLTMVGVIAEEITGLPREKINIQPTFLGGGFGRRLEWDFVEQALRIAKVIKKPVKLLWSREEDTQHDFYRPASMARLEVGLDEAGNVVDWRQVLVSPEIMERVWPEWNVMNLGWLPYSFFMKGLQLEGTEHSYLEEPKATLDVVSTPVPLGMWRSVGDSHNGFYVQSMMDEAADAAGADPAAYLKRHLTGQDRHLGVLDLVTNKAGWGKAARGRFQGVAIHESFRSVAAHVVELSVEELGPEKWKLNIHRITTAVDCGLAVNPAGVRAQVESSLVWALTATLLGEITIKDGRVQESNFHDYEMLRMAQTPPMEIHIVKSDRPSTGIGEPAVPPLAPALTNAIFAATGKRLRSLPLKRHGFVV